MTKQRSLRKDHCNRSLPSRELNNSLKNMSILTKKTRKVQEFLQIQLLISNNSKSILKIKSLICQKSILYLKLQTKGTMTRGKTIRSRLITISRLKT